MPEDAERLELLRTIQRLSPGDLRNLKDCAAGELDAATLDRLRKYGDIDATVERRDKFLALDGDIDAARSMEIEGNIHTADNDLKSMWVVSHYESTLKEKGIVLMELDAPLEGQKYVTLDARLLLQHKWPGYEAWEDYVEACVDGKEPAFPCCAAGAPPCRRPADWLPSKARPVVYFDAHGREKDLPSALQWALRRAGLPALAELSDVLLDKAPKGLLPSDLRKLDARLPDALKLKAPEHLEAVAELFRQRHVSVAGHWMEPRGHAAWQLLRQ